MKELAEGGLPWILAEDNPVISPCEEITLNKTRERLPYSAGDKLPEPTGDELKDLPGNAVPFQDCRGVNSA